MRASDQAAQLIKQFEGFSAVPYEDAAGHMTIGYGHRILPDECFEAISEEEAQALLCRDMEEAEAAVNALVEVDLDQHQFDALVSFVYNIGAGAFSRSTLLRYVNNEDFGRAAAQLDRWVYAAGERLRGLESRRKAEKSLFLNAVFV